jgi:hypothetical protein
MPNDKVTGKRRETTTEVHISVIEKKSGGQKLPRNCRVTSILKSHGAGIMKEWQQHNIEDSNRSGRPSKFSDSDVRYLKRLSDKDPPAPLAEITRDSGLNVSEDTVGEH